MLKVMEIIKRTARSDSNVLITGESGSGKDYLARRIHDQSGRANEPFYSINCAALPPGLAESELFGHEKGAFTGANGRKRGLLELAEGGTLLLNEIGELSLPLQAKLLTFLDTKKFTRVGGEKEIETNLRLIAATNREIKKEVDRGAFRNDLYYRLNVVQIEVPPLRERLEDLPNIVRDILRELCGTQDCSKIQKVDRSQIESLKRYNWPGNIRELRNGLERALVLSPEGKLSLQYAMPLEFVGPSEEVHRGLAIESGENDWLLSLRFRRDHSDQDPFKETMRLVIHEALRRAKGNKSQAARLLGVTLSKLKSKLKTLGISGSK